MQTTPQLQCQHLNKRFGNNLVVDDLSFSLFPGECLGVIGPNGAGKTTLLDMICGKTKPTGGKILFKDIDITELMEYQITRLGIGRKFQTPSVYDQLTVFENLEISHPNPRGVLGSVFFKRTDSMTQKISEVANKIFLGDHLADTAAILSHGQKQWLEIGMLLAQEAKLLLVDEPAAGMTDEETAHTGDLLLSLAGKHTIVVIEHDMVFVRQISQGRKVTVLHQGSVLCEGPVDTVQSDPKVVEVYLGRKHSR
jgi:urea transport system ATP-binding protein